MGKRIRAVAMLGLAALAACDRGAAPQHAQASADANVSFLADDAVWREQRRQELLQPDGWTSLVGLHWLELKAHYIGSGAASGIRLAAGPAKMGLVQQQDGRVFFTPERGVALTVDGAPLKGRVELKSDREGAPTAIGFDEGKGVMTLIKRGDRLALRVKHADAPTRLGFRELDYWPADPAWRIKGRFVAHPPGKTIPVMDIVGISTETPNPGAVEFERNGKTFRLEALGEGDSLFFVFVDRTSGHGSYPAGRFLDAAAPDADGTVVLDFNHAYNPPCAFTPYATCPLAPPENRLVDLAVEAGEKIYHLDAAQ
ncbi:MAG: DUF1684 domain-containing protein [Pseudoxanthomonas sp.]